MVVIENRKELVDKIRSKEIENVEKLQSLAKHVAVEAVEKCVKEHEERVGTFLNELNCKRMKKIELLAASS